MSDDENSTKLTKREIMLRGTVISVLISVPSLMVFVLVWFLLDDLILGAVLGVVVHFIAMGFSLKISKKLLVKK